MLYSELESRKMIRSFKHRGLKRLFESGNRRGVSPDHADKLLRILDRLDAAVMPNDMRLPGYRLHALKGDLDGHWAVDVSGNYRVIFGFDGADVVDVDYGDYH